MNLTQMSDFITNELGVYDTTSKALARTFLDKEYRVLWDKYPWADTQDTKTVSVLAGTNTVPYPAGIERAITIRATNIAEGGGDTPDYVSDARFLDPVTSTFLIESDPDIFDRGGVVQYYEESADIITGVKSLRLFPTPLISTDLYIVGKAPCPGLSADADTSRIRNLDNVLIAYAYFDMLQRLRQYAKAAEKRKEAMELEQNAWNLEQAQANQPRRSKTVTAAGNSLGEMVDAVCNICGQWAPEYRIVIKDFVRRNYYALYDLFLWPESQLFVRVPYTTEQVIMPPYVDKVLGVRGSDDFSMFPNDGILFLGLDPTIFERVGQPVGYTTLTPVGVSTLPATTQPLLLASTSPVDTSSVFIRGEVISSGKEITESVNLNGFNPVQTQFTYDIPITVAKGLTIGDMTVNAAGDSTLLAIIPAKQRELKHQRLWFLPIPDVSKLGPGSGTGETAFTCLVMAKRLIQPLMTDEDTPIITGAQQVLVAAAASDIFRKLEKPDLMADMAKRAESSTAALKAKNTDQAAFQPRFIPKIEPTAYVTENFGW